MSVERARRTLFGLGLILLGGGVLGVAVGGLGHLPYYLIGVGMSMSGTVVILDRYE